MTELTERAARQAARATKAAVRARGGRPSRAHGVTSVRTEKIGDDEFTVEVHAPESFPARRRGNGRVGKYANPKPQTLAGRGASSGVWTGSQGDQTQLNACMSHTKAATAWAEKHGSLIDAPARVLGRRALIRAVRAARDFRTENCPVYDQAHVMDDLDEDLARLEREFDR